MAPPRLLPAGLALLALAGCGGGNGATPAVRLPPGELAAAVPQPSDEPGFVPLLAQSGTADVARIAALSPDPVAAAAALRAHGFVVGYVVEYLDAGAGRVLTCVVSRFAAAAGADADLAGDLAAAPAPGAAVLDLPVVGARSRVERGPLPGGPPGAQLVTVRARSGRDTYLLAAGARGPVDPAAVRQVMAVLLARSGGPGRAVSLPGPDLQPAATAG